MRETFTRFKNDNNANLSELRWCEDLFLCNTVVVVLEKYLFGSLTMLIYSHLCYLAVQTHPAAIQGLLAEPGGSTQVVLPCGGIDDLQPLVPNRPVHAEVGCFARLAGLSVAYSFENKKTKTTNGQVGVC